MGHHHAKHLARMKQAQFVGIVDSDATRVESLARRFRTRAFTKASDLIGHVDAVVIATPTPSHHSVGELFLKAGISCLIEKPLASTLLEAESLIALAESHHAILQVGHVERFNPAVIEASRHIQAPQFIEVSRLGPYDPRVADIGVVMDLMIHDLDIVLFLVGEEVTRVEAFGAKILSNHEDIAKVRLHFKNGCIADLSASRVSLEKYRRIRIFQKDAYLSLDYAGQKLKVYKKKSPVVKSLADIQILRPKLAKKDALALELAHFVQCIQEKRMPLVSGQHGRDALQLAREVLENLRVHA
jgi:predicted dehydrogenase